MKCVNYATMKTIAGHLVKALPYTLKNIIKLWEPEKITLD